MIINGAFTNLQELVDIIIPVVGIRGKMEDSTVQMNITPLFIATCVPLIIRSLVVYTLPHNASSSSS